MRTAIFWGACLIAASIGDGKIPEVSDIGLWVLFYGWLVFVFMDIVDFLHGRQS